MKKAAIVTTFAESRQPPVEEDVLSIDAIRELMTTGRSSRWTGVYTHNVKHPCVVLHTLPDRGLWEDPRESAPTPDPIVVEAADIEEDDGGIRLTTKAMRKVVTGHLRTNGLLGPFPVAVSTTFATASAVSTVERFDTIIEPVTSIWKCSVTSVCLRDGAMDALTEKEKK